VSARAREGGTQRGSKSPQSVRHKPVLEFLAREFEQSTGHALAITYSSAGGVLKRIQAGDVADVAFLPRPIMNDIVRQGRISLGSTTDIAYSTVGMGIRSGAVKPDISSVEAVRRTLLAAESIAYVDPARGSASANHFVRVLEHLGIAEEMRPKTRLVRDPALFAAKGNVELVVLQISELKGVPGLDVVGPLPPALQNPLAFTIAAGISSDAAEPEAGRMLIQFLRSPTAAKVMKLYGLEPASR
jgi:molybdate transport system substrate-binding protein